jgi:hypothetical protein
MDMKLPTLVNQDEHAAEPGDSREGLGVERPVEQALRVARTRRARRDG